MRSQQNRGLLRGVAARAAMIVGASVVFGAASVSAQPECVGDCDGNGTVSIAELIRAVGISLGNNDVSTCEAADANGNGAVAINELIQAVNNSLFGCGFIPPTATPTPVVFSSSCNLADTSGLTLSTGLLVLGPFVPEGDFSIDCEEDNGDLSCGCSLDNFEPLNIPGIGDICIDSFSPCEARTADCNGDTGIDVNLMADHNIGQCNGNADCRTQCDARCDSLGAGFFRQSSTCEDFCLGGENDGDMCMFDTDCPGGSCGGPDGGADGTICECVCVQPGVGTGIAGGLSCGLGVAITVELDENGICGDVPPTINLAPTCGELTTNTSIGQLDNAANQPITIGPTTLMGAQTSCDDLRAGTVSGANLVGHLAFFGSAVGDILSEIDFVCE